MSTTHHLDNLIFSIEEIAKAANKMGRVPRDLRMAIDSARARAGLARRWKDAAAPVQRTIEDFVTPKDPHVVTPYSDRGTSLKAAKGTIETGAARNSLLLVLEKLESSPSTADDITDWIETHNRLLGRGHRSWSSTISSRLKGAEDEGFVIRPGDEAKTRTGSLAKRYHITNRGREKLAQLRAKRR